MYILQHIGNYTGGTQTNSFGLFCFVFGVINAYQARCCMGQRQLSRVPQHHEALDTPCPPRYRWFLTIPKLQRRHHSQGRCLITQNLESCQGHKANTCRYGALGQATNLKETTAHRRRKRGARCKPCWGWGGMRKKCKRLSISWRLVDMPLQQPGIALCPDYSAALGTADRNQGRNERLLKKTELSRDFLHVGCL